MFTVTKVLWSTLSILFNSGRSILQSFC